MRTRLAVALSVIAITACTNSKSAPARRYIGTATPSTPGPLCSASRAEAQIRDGKIILAPDEGTWILYGLVSEDGTVSADKTQQAASKQPWETTFDGHWTSAAVTGTYTTPRCSFAIVLKPS
jgi:hypothetical protein